MSRIQRLAQLGQSAWLDSLDRRLMTSGELRRLIEEDGLRGVTTNPSIFRKAVVESSDYDAFIRDATPNESEADILERVMIRDLQMACDTLRPVYDKTGGVDGFASIEVAPDIAHDTAAQIEQAKRLWDAVARPNLMVKIPATRPGIPAITSCLAHGININVTLLFSVSRCREVAEAHMHALERRLAANQPIDRIASVASLFVSRIDTKVDPLVGDDSPLRGQIAIANATLAYEQWEHLMATDRWKALAAKGARPQRLLWGSTEPKDERYADTYYAEALVARDTVDTMTPDVFKAYLAHGEPELRLDQNRERAHQQMSELAKLGIDLATITEQLEDEGVEKFVKAFKESQKAIASKRRSADQRESVQQHAR